MWRLNNNCVNMIVNYGDRERYGSNNFDESEICQLFESLTRRRPVVDRSWLKFLWALSAPSGSAFPHSWFRSLVSEARLRCRLLGPLHILSIVRVE